MRWIALIVFVFFAPAIAMADCIIDGIWPLSPNVTLNRNGIIILEFNGVSQEIVPGLCTIHPVYLKSEKGEVILSVVETFTGEKDLTEVVLKPASILAANETYALWIDGLPEFQSGLTYYNTSTRREESLTYRTNDEIDTIPPVFNANPSEQKKTLVRYGCGPASWVYFTMTGIDKSELFVKARVRSKTSGKTSVYILAITNGVVKVGRDMCRGAFTFSDGDNFEVVFLLYDQSGNKSKLEKRIAFTKPVINTEDE